MGVAHRRRPRLDDPGVVAASPQAADDLRAVARLEHGHRTPAPCVAARRRPSGVHRRPWPRRRRRRRSRTRPGRTPGAGSRRPSSRGRSTARRPAAACPGVSVWRVRLRGASELACARVEPEERAPVLVADAGLRVDQAGPEPRVVRLDEADRATIPVRGAQVDGAAAGGQRGWQRPRRHGRGRWMRPAAAARSRSRKRSSAPGSIASRSVSQRSRSASAMPGSLQPQVDPARIGDAQAVERGRGRRLEVVEDGERLEGDRAAAVGRVAQRGQAAIGGGDGRAPVGPVRGQVAARMGDPASAR